MTRPISLTRTPGCRRWLSRLAAAALLCGLLYAATPAPARAGEPDQSQTAPPNGSIDVTGTRWPAQTFTAGITGRLDQVDLLLDRDGSPGDLTVQIRNASAGTPGPTVLASETVAQTNIPEESGWVSIAFDATAPSVAGTQYAIVLFAGTGSGEADPDNSYLWEATSDDPGGDRYPGGEGHVSQDGGASWQAHRTDFAFRTYVAQADTTAPSSTATPSPGALPSGHRLISVTATATFKTTAGTTVGSIGPVRCWNTRGLKMTFNATDGGGSGVASLTYSASGAQPITATTVTTLPATVSITTPGVTKLAYAATDNAGNVEQPANSQTVLVGSGFACATPTPSRFAIPTHGSVTVRGTAVIGGHTIPFNTTIRY